MNEYEIQQFIHQWVYDNYGESEAQIPSWSTRNLAKAIAEHFNEKEKCNGWSNYATWRVNLELLDGEENAIREDKQVFDTVRDLADHLEQQVEDYLDMIESENSNINDFNPLRSYCDAFLQDVNWYEIAETMATDNPEFVKEKK